MRLLLLLVQVCLCMFVCSAQTTSSLFIDQHQKKSGAVSTAASDDWMAKATSQLDKETYRFKKTGKDYAVLNTKQNLVFGVSANKLIINPSENKASWSAALELLSIGNKIAAQKASLITNENYLK